MAIGLIPKYATVYAASDSPPEHLLICSIEAAAKLGWRIHYISRSGFVALATDYPAQIMLRIKGSGASITGTSLRSAFFDGGSNKKQVGLLIRTIEEQKSAHSSSDLDARYQELLPYLPLPEDDAFLKPKSKVRSQAGDIMAIFRPAAGYFITPVILNLNLLIFALMVISGVGFLEPDSSSLISWGANLGGLTLRGEWWRLLTCTFLHVGVFHLAMNMYAFLLIGAQLEQRLGAWRFLLAYIAAGIMASLSSLLVHDFVISAGASGAIFGMYGVFLALLITGLVEKANRKPLMASILFFVCYNLLNGIKPGIDNAAHIGGLLAGLAIGYAYASALRRKSAQVVPVVAKAAILPEEYWDGD